MSLEISFPHFRQGLFNSVMNGDETFRRHSTSVLSTVILREMEVERSVIFADKISFVEPLYNLSNWIPIKHLSAEFSVSVTCF
jgi:hypothetical protein